MVLNKQEALKEQWVGKKIMSPDSHLSANFADPFSKHARSISFEGFTSFLEPISTGKDQRRKCRVSHSQARMDFSFQRTTADGEGIQGSPGDVRPRGARYPCPRAWGESRQTGLPC